MATMGETKNKETNEVRKTFVAMLFALVIAAISTNVVRVLLLISSELHEGTSLLDSILGSEGVLFASLLHSTLALLLVSTSWIGWSASLAVGHERQINSLLSWSFLLLLVEVLLVTLYFATSATVEIPNEGSISVVSQLFSFPSAKPEAILMTMVFFIYAIWDFIADVLLAKISTRNLKLKIKSYFSGFLTYCSASIICCLLCLFIFLNSNRESDLRNTIYLDIALMVILFLFRELKPFEYFPQKLFQWEVSREGAKIKPPPSLRSYLIVATLFFLVSILVCKA